MKKFFKILEEDNPLQPIAAGSKQGWLWLASVMVGCTICVPVFVFGAQMSAMLVFPYLVLACFLGGLFCTALGYATGLIGMRTGLPTAMIVSQTFGSRGSWLANLVSAFGGIGWFGIQTAVFAAAFVSLAEKVWGLTLPLTPVIIVGGLVMSTTAVVGFRGLGKLSYVAIPLLMALLLWPLSWFWSQGGLAQVWQHQAMQPSSLGMVIAMIAGAYSFTAVMPDMTRFMRSKSHLMGGLVVNFLFAYPLLLLLSATLAIASGQPDFMATMLAVGMGGLAIVVLFLATWTTNDTNVYTAAVTLNPLVPGMQRWQLAALVGLGGTMAAVLGLFEHFTSWLILFGNIFGPLAGVYVTHYWLNQSLYHGKAIDNQPSYRWGPLLAWVAGTLLAVLTSPAESMGLAYGTLSGLPLLDGLLFGALLTWGLQPLTKKTP